MTPWYPLAIVVSLLFGAHNVFLKRAAGRVPDAWGALVLEATAAAVILVAFVAMMLLGKAPPVPRDPGGLALAAVAGTLVGVASVLYFSIFRLGAPLSVAVPCVLIGWVVVTAALGVAFEGEPIAWRHGVGVAFAMCAIWLLR